MEERYYVVKYKHRSDPYEYEACVISAKTEWLARKKFHEKVPGGKIVTIKLYDEVHKGPKKEYIVQYYIDDNKSTGLRYARVKAINKLDAERVFYKNIVNKKSYVIKNIV